MPTIFLRIFHLYNLLNTALLYLVPKKLRTYLPTSWYPQHPPTTITKTTAPPPTPPPPLASRYLCRMDSDDLRLVFQMFDKNGDGKVSQRELNDSLENMGIFIPDPELNQMIEKIDENQDGCVDINEFGALYNSIIDGWDEGEGKDLREAFDVFDKNGDGLIAAEELVAVMAALGLKQWTAMEDCRRMITMVDSDGDGRVCFEEFREMMRGAGGDGDGCFVLQH